MGRGGLGFSMQIANILARYLKKKPSPKRDSDGLPLDFFSAISLMEKKKPSSVSAIPKNPNAFTPENISFLENESQLIRSLKLGNFFLKVNTFNRHGFHVIIRHWRDTTSWV